jgi:pimeloyl-ACP methyl ester carboxylesterase
MWARSSDTNIYYEDRGSGPGAPLLLLHGLGGSTKAWSDVVPFLEARRRTIVCDLRGCGQSDRGTAALQFPQLAEDALRVLDEAGIDRCHVVGHSLGGVIAQELLTASGERIASAVLISTSSKIGEKASKGWRRLADVVETRGLSNSVESQKRTFSDAFAEANPEILQRLATESKDIDNAAYAELARTASAYDYTDALSNVRHPVLIIQGGADKMTTPAGSVILERALENGTMEIVDDVGHNAQIEMGERLAVRILDFADEVEAADNDL